MKKTGAGHDANKLNPLGAGQDKGKAPKGKGGKKLPPWLKKK